MVNGFNAKVWSEDSAIRNINLLFSSTDCYYHKIKRGDGNSIYLISEMVINHIDEVKEFFVDHDSLEKVVTWSQSNAEKFIHVLISSAGACIHYIEKYDGIGVYAVDDKLFSKILTAVNFVVAFEREFLDLDLSVSTPKEEAA